MKIANLIQKDCAAVCKFGFSAARRNGARERAFLVAEQFAFEKPRRNCRTVHFDERAGGERALAMDVRGEQFFSGSGLSGEKHASVRPRDERGLLEGVLKDGAGADHPWAITDDLPKPFVLPLQAGLFKRILHDDEHLFAAERLFQKIESAGPSGFDRIRDRSMA